LLLSYIKPFIKEKLSKLVINRLIIKIIFSII
jgi:hypothetical protein